jgi:hypothetical protein
MADNFGICKKCVRDHVHADNLASVIPFLQLMNIPFIRDSWEIAKENSAAIGKYMSLMSLGQNKNLRYEDSDSVDEKSGINSDADKSNDVDEYIGDIEITFEVIRRWGKNLGQEDYIFLEDYYAKLKRTYACETPIQMNLYKNMAKAQLMANKALENDDVAKMQKAMKTLSELMNDANVKPVQEDQNANDGGLNSWGEWIKKIEETEPCLDDRFDKDSDHIEKYTKRWYIHQMKRILGLAKEDDVQKLEGE